MGYSAGRMKQLLKFLQSQRILVLATHDEKGPWMAPVYFASQETGVLYFISPKDTQHGQMILQDPKTAFCVTWSDPSNLENRKGVQGVGLCRIARGMEIAKGLATIHAKFPSFKKQMTLKWIKENAWGARVWILKPTYAKYWDDELYGEEESEEFTFK